MSAALARPSIPPTFRLDQITDRPCKHGLSREQLAGWLVDAGLARTNGPGTFVLTAFGAEMIEDLRCWVHERYPTRQNGRVKQQPNDALIAMRLADAEREEPPPPKLPEAPLQPIVPLAIPPADWRAEERERVEREGGGSVEEIEPPESLQSRPAAKQAKPKRTPNLDRVRGWSRP